MPPWFVKTSPKTSLIMAINFNPNLPPNDSLIPWDIEANVAARNTETQDLAKKAYEVGGVPPTAAERASRHMGVTRQTAEAKKDIRDARSWWKAKRSEENGDDD